MKLKNQSKIILLTQLPVKILVWKEALRNSVAKWDICILKKVAHSKKYKSNKLIQVICPKDLKIILKSFRNITSNMRKF